MVTTLYKCPCCGAKTLDELGDYLVCPVCHWEDDPAQTQAPDLEDGANAHSLNEARKIYRLKTEESRWGHFSLCEQRESFLVPAGIALDLLLLSR